MPRPWYFSDRFRSTARRTAVFLVVCAVYALLSQLPVVARVNAWGRGQFLRFGTAVGGVVERVFRSEASTVAQLAACQDTLRVVAGEAVMADQYQHDVEELEALLGYVRRTGAEGVPARVISRSVESMTAVRIDRGSEDGVVRGMAAIISDGILYGIVVKVEAHTAIVRLTSDRASAIPAAILGDRKTIGLAEGQEGALLAMEYIEQDADISVDDLVVTSGLDNLVPEGLILGTITDIVQQESAPFKRALVEPFHDPREWTAVLLVPPPGTDL